MTEENVLVEPEQPPDAQPAPVGPATPVRPPQSRFLFVDVAALRAKQLRRGALPRLRREGEAEDRQELPFKPERIAMEEVRRGLVEFYLPDQQPASEPIAESR
ncbi:MAG: DNA-directed RNA polymerase subunit omega [Vicinamibacterales bacterium]